MVNQIQLADLLKSTKGQLRSGNIDIANRPIVNNEDGAIATLVQKMFGIDGGRQLLIPTIVNGKKVTDEEALKQFRKTRQNLGVFDNPENADSAARFNSWASGILHGRGQ